MMENIAQLLEAIAWPIVALAAGLAFKNELKALIGRIRKGAGVEFDPPPQTAAATTDPLDASRDDSTSQLPRSPVTHELEELISGFPMVAEAPDAERRANVLLTIAARALLVLQFEQVESSIWGSQVALLNHLNSKTTGEELSVVRKVFYERAEQEFPEFFANYSFDGYVGFLVQRDLVRQDRDLLTLSQKGHEYLHWRVEQRKPPKLYG